MATLITSDTHFNHLFCALDRAFRNVIEHDEWLIDRWNKQVGKKDTVYHVGDFCFGDHTIVRRIRARLNGRIHLILGNHDYANKIKNIPGLFSSINDILEIKIEKHPVILCHYSMRTWSKSHYNSWQLFGHSHGKLDSLECGKSFDVGLDANNFTLWTEEAIMKKMIYLPDNFNLLKKE